MTWVSCWGELTSCFLLLLIETNFQKTEPLESKEMAASGHKHAAEGRGWERRLCLLSGDLRGIYKCTPPPGNDVYFVTFERMRLAESSGNTQKKKRASSEVQPFWLNAEGTKKLWPPESHLSPTHQKIAHKSLIIYQGLSVSFAGGSKMPIAILLHLMEECMAALAYREGWEQQTNGSYVAGGGGSCLLVISSHQLRTETRVP